jgi:hypothetical protein
LSTKCEEIVDFACCVVYANTPLELLILFYRFKRKLVVCDATWKGTLFKTQLGFGVQFLERHIVQNKIRVWVAIGKEYVLYNPSIALSVYEHVQS